MVSVPGATKAGLEVVGSAGEWASESALAAANVFSVLILLDETNITVSKLDPLGSGERVTSPRRIVERRGRCC